MRAVGSGHSWSDVALGAGFLVEPQRARRAARARPRARRRRHRAAAADPGRHAGPRAQRATRRRAAWRWLDMGGYDGQTFAGVISTATHGSGHRATARSPTSSRSIDLVAAGGGVHRIEPADGTDRRGAYARRAPRPRAEPGRPAVRRGARRHGPARHRPLADDRGRARLPPSRCGRCATGRGPAGARRPAFLAAFAHYRVYLSPYGDGGQPVHDVQSRRRGEAAAAVERGRRSLSPEFLALLPGIPGVINQIADLAPARRPADDPNDAEALADDEYIGKSYRCTTSGARTTAGLLRRDRRAGRRRRPPPAGVDASARSRPATRGSARLPHLADVAALRRTVAAAMAMMHGRPR